MITFMISGARPSGLSPRLFDRLADVLGAVPKLSGRKTWQVGVRFVTPREIQRLNRVFRSKDRPTDVLSFSAIEGQAFPDGSPEAELGDLVICTSVAKVEAKRRLMDPVEELVRLLAHGVLHLAGMDHATQADEERMFGLQERIVEKVLTPPQRKTKSHA
jgi:probable rRNA maturation factor